MLCLKNPHSRDNDIDFMDSTHSYIIRGSSNYVSCTKFVKSFFEIFNADAIIDNMMKSDNWVNSKYFGMSKHEIKKQWNDSGIKAAKYGTLLHSCIEDYYNSKPVNNSSIEYQYFLSFVKDHPQLTPFRTEMRIYDEDINICGTVDMLFINEDNTISIYDWKFSKEIQYTSSFGKKALDPISHLDDCNITHYSLQLNIYRHILENKYGYTIKDMYLVFMHEQLSDNYIKVPVYEIDLSNLFKNKKLKLIK